MIIAEIGLNHMGSEALAMRMLKRRETSCAIKCRGLGFTDAAVSAGANLG